MDNEEVIASSDEVAVSGVEGTEASPKKPAKRYKGRIVAAVVAIVVVVAGFGFWTWHEQPSFCAAICHTPMDKYYETYSAELGSDEATLVTYHAQMKLTCLSCHPAELKSQIQEGMHWISGDYAFDTETGKLMSRSNEFATADTCINESCHTYGLEGLAQRTADKAWNPHDFSEHGVTDCGSCHSMHGTSTYVCTQCHYQAVDEVPEGWDALPYRELTEDQQEQEAA